MRQHQNPRDGREEGRERPAPLLALLFRKSVHPRRDRVQRAQTDEPLEQGGEANVGMAQRRGRAGSDDLPGRDAAPARGVGAEEDAPSSAAAARAAPEAAAAGGGADTDGLSPGREQGGLGPGGGEAAGREEKEADDGETSREHQGSLAGVFRDRFGGNGNGGC